MVWTQPIYLNRLLLLLKTQSCVSWDTVFITHYWDPVRFLGMKLKESYFSFHPYAPKVKEYWHLIWHTITVYSISNCFAAILNFFLAFFSQLHWKVASLNTTIFFTFEIHTFINSASILFSFILHLFTFLIRGEFKTV